jgi:hypothetical protein
MIVPSLASLMSNKPHLSASTHRTPHQTPREEHQGMEERPVISSQGVSIVDGRFAKPSSERQLSVRVAEP